MNLEYFIAKRLATDKEYKSSVSAPIIKIAIAAISISIVMMMIAIATGTGLQRKIKEKVAAFNGHIQIFKYDSNNSDTSLNPVSINQDFYPEFTGVEGVNHIQAIASKGGIIRTENTFEGIVAKGVGADYRWDYMKDFLIEGRLPDFKGKLNEEVLISSYFAKRLQFELNDTFFAFFPKNDGSLSPNNRVFKVVGIYDSSFEEFDATYIFIDIRHIQRMNKWEKDEVGSFEVFIDDFSSTELMEKGREVYGAIHTTLDSRTIADSYLNIFDWLSLFDFNIGIIIGIMIIVGGINMITALLVLILERTQMIGVLKALGISNWGIRKIFLYNAGYLISIGLFWGNVIGLGLLFAQKYFGLITLNPASYYVSEAPVHIALDYILILNVGTLILCVLMLLIPSYIITKISPVKAIRFE